MQISAIIYPPSSQPHHALNPRHVTMSTGLAHRARNELLRNMAVKATRSPQLALAERGERDTSLVFCLMQTSFQRYFFG